MLQRLTYQATLRREEDLPYKNNRLSTEKIPQRCIRTSLRVQPFGLEKGRENLITAYPEYSSGRISNKTSIMKVLRHCSKRLWLLASFYRLELVVQDPLV